MKSHLLLLTLLLSAPAVLADSCCSTPLPADLGGHSETTPPASTNSLPDTSIYHLEGNWSRQDGQQTSLANFQGQPCLFTMFFTSCTYACPMLVEDLKRILTDLPDAQKKNLNVVLLSFDSERDQPAALAEFATLRDLSAPPWTLMHGSKDIVQELAAVLGVRYRQDGEGNFAHSNIITLLNEQGEIVYKLDGLRADSAPLLEAIGTLIPSTKINR